MLTPTTKTIPDTPTPPKTRPNKAMVTTLELISITSRDNAPLVVCGRCDVSKGDKISVILPNDVTYVGTVATAEEQGANTAVTFGGTFEPAPK
jgi:hypothetical protein